MDVSGPQPLDMLRAVPRIRSTPLGFLRDCVERYGDLVAFPIPGRSVLLVNHPDAVRRVLLERHAGYGKATVQYTALAAVTGLGLLTAENREWKPRRAIAQPAFHHSGFPVIAEAACQAATHLRIRLQADPGGDAEIAVLQTMLEVVTQTLFDTRLDQARGRALVEAVDEALRLVIAQSQLPLPPALAFLTRRRRLRLARAIATIDRTCARVVADRRRHGLTDQDRDLLAHLLRAQDAGALDARAVRDEMVTMVIAGHETVAAALTWTLHLLARHPGEQELLAAELDDVLGPPGPPDAGGTRTPAWDDVPRLVRTRAVLDEALRLYPPAWVITRTALAEDTLTVDGREVVVPAGTLMIVSPWLLHRRDQVWPDPDRFDPSRFLTGASSRPSVDYLPFGLGPRMCIGRDVALIEAVLVLAGLLHSVRVLPGSSTDAPGGEPAVDAMITMRPHGGMPLRVVERRRDGEG